MDDDTFKNELYRRLSTVDRAADTLGVINGSLEALREKLSLRHSVERHFDNFA
jgi:hypothetical protein